MGKDEEKEDEKKSIHKREGISTFYTIKEIEKVFHPRAQEKVRRDLEKLTAKFAKDHIDEEKGDIKDVTKATDAFMGMLAKYHFEGAYDSLKEMDGGMKHIADTLRDNYNVKKEDLIKQFIKKGVYKSMSDIFKYHVDPLVDKVHEKKQEHAQISLSQYLQDQDTGDELSNYIQTKLGHKLKKKRIYALSDALALIQCYMQAPGAAKQLGKQESLNVPMEIAGNPNFNAYFEKGKEFSKLYESISTEVDDMHKLKAKKK